QDVLWHLQRMYRLRNAIVHGGELPSDFTQINSHLGTYLWATLRVAIEEFSRPGGIRELRKVFEKYTWLFDNVSRLLQDDPNGDPLFEIRIQPQGLGPV